MMSRSEQPSPSKIYIAIAYLIVIAYWVLYLTKGAPTFTANDWMKEQVFSNLLRESFHTLQLPWRMSVDYYHGGVYELIANPEVSLTPDFLLLYWVPNNYYFIVHWMIFVTVGFFGLLQLAKKFSISSLPFIYFVILFNCNGFIGAHLSEGHIQWAAYFLIPLFFYWVSDLGNGHAGNENLPSLKISLLLGFMFLNGSFHIAIWCLMFIVIALFYRHDLLRPVGIILLLSGLMGVGRLGPAAAYFPPKTDFVSGYPSFSILLDAFTFVYHPEKPTFGGAFGTLVWHEYCFYIGFIGMIFLLSGVYVYFKSKTSMVPSWWIPSALVMMTLSMGDVYQIIPNSGLPFSTIERVASRFIVIPFIVFLTFAAVGFTQLQLSSKRYTNLVLFASLVPMLGEIFQNARNWRIKSYESVVGSGVVPIVTIVESHDHILRVIVLAGWSISAIACVLTVSRLLVLKNRMRKTAKSMQD